VIKRTSRGFQIVEFKDIYGTDCTLQKSSLAEREALWLGPHEASPQICIPGKGWQPVPFPEGTLFTTRMHLDKKAVRKLMVYLQNWLDHNSFDKPRAKK